MATREDLEFLEDVFRRMRPSRRISRSFTVIRSAAILQRAVVVNTNSESVGSKSSVDEPPGT
jgi:hypothetical protein